jgi:hypothetical protein
MSSSKYENFQAVSVLLVMFGVGAIALSPISSIKAAAGFIIAVIMAVNIFLNILSLIVTFIRGYDKEKEIKTKEV